MIVGEFVRTLLHGESVHTARLIPAEVLSVELARVAQLLAEDASPARGDTKGMRVDGDGGRESRPLLRELIALEGEHRSVNRRVPVEPQPGEGARRVRQADGSWVVG